SPPPMPMSTPSASLYSRQRSSRARASRTRFTQPISSASSRGSAVQKILITGANGHLGANLVRALVAEGAELRVLLRPESDNSPTDDLDVERVFGDLRDTASLEAATKGCHAVYHCAAQLSTASGGEQEIFASNVLGTRNLLDAARRNGVGRVVVTGSLSATGHRLDAPTDESVPFNPFERHLPYAVSKAAVEHECL